MATGPVYFPPGITTIAVKLYFGDPTGRPASGKGRVIAERKFGYAGTSWTSDVIGKWLPAVQGNLTLTVPHSNQPGLTGDFGAAITNIGFRFQFQPLNSGPIDTKATVLLPQSLGASVNLAALADLGGWPNQTVVVNPGGGGGGTTGGITYTETSPGSGLYHATVV